MKKRILIFSIAYEPLVGGAELAVRHITDRLPQYEFDLITCRFKKDHLVREKIGNVNVYRVGFGTRIGRYLYPAMAYRLGSKLHKQRPYQIVWSIMAAYAGLATLMFLRRNSKAKFLLTLQEGDSIEHIHGQVRGFRRQWQKIFKTADYIQAISNFLADWAKKEGATCPIEVVPNGVDLDEFKIYDLRFKNERDSKIIITTSRLVHKNGVDILIRAASELKALIPDSKLIIQILGTGPDEQKLKKLAKDLKLEDTVQFLGNIEPDKIPDYLNKADIFVRPSRSEGLGISFLEAMAAGLPVIATKVGGIPDFLKDRETGLFAKVDDPKDLAEKITLLAEDHAMYDKIRTNARRLIEAKYSWERIASQMDKIFQEILS